MRSTVVHRAHRFVAARRCCRASRRRVPGARRPCSTGWPDWRAPPPARNGSRRRGSAQTRPGPPAHPRSRTAPRTPRPWRRSAAGMEFTKSQNYHVPTFSNELAPGVTTKSGFEQDLGISFFFALSHCISVLCALFRVRFNNCCALPIEPSVALPGP